MLTKIHPKLPMRNLSNTKDFYFKIGFENCGVVDYEEYLMLKKDDIEIHFFLFENLNPNENYGMVYIRTGDIDGLYKNFTESKIEIHRNGKLEMKPWGIREFSILDPDYNLLTFGEHRD
ncbi:VOC family protein [Chryseobacterium suipulveris]|uniref:VOC family protein n=1 Tax=Chryseobacterium suipulveris TaxID=2929800 RepID=A0ABY4BWM0_9FLAO|nr:VOC family protein [Chryseobacterium suipulveris]UOE42103.1 VOC family protein [Chryseobacterium suipulveris]